jgi:hypothetical protein
LAFPKLRRGSFLAGVGDAARAAGALFVLDEVITFRPATGGAPALAGVEPDLTTFGKLIGGGFPVGALGGRADVLQVTDPVRGGLPLSGTFNANPVTMAAGAASVRELTAERIVAIDQWCGRLADGLTRAAAEHGVPLSVRIDHGSREAGLARWLHPGGGHHAYWFSRDAVGSDVLARPVRGACTTPHRTAIRLRGSCGAYSRTVIPEPATAGERRGRDALQPCGRR